MSGDGVHVRLTVKGGGSLCLSLGCHVLPTESRFYENEMPAIFLSEFYFLYGPINNFLNCCAKVSLKEK